jgi:hypothetical protein
MIRGLAVCLVALPLAAVAQQPLPSARIAQHLRFGGDAQLPVPLSRVSSLLVFPDRRVLVLDSRSRSLSLFDSAGRFVKEFARRGEGPGEIRDAMRIGRFRDTVWVYMPWFPTDRASFYSLEGAFLRQREIDSRSATGLRGGQMSDMQLPLAVLENGWSINNVMTGALTDPGPRFGVVRFSSTMQPTDTIVSYEVASARVRWGRGFNPGHENPFADFPLVAVQPGGTHLLVLDRTAGAAALQLGRIATATMRREWAVTYPMPARRLASGEIDSLIRVSADIQRERAGPMAARLGTAGEFAASVKEGTRIPQNAPLARELIAGMDGTAWVRLWDSGSNWIVFDAAGRAVQRVTLPANATLLAAQRDYIWCVITDSSDVPWVTTFRVRV